MGNPNQGNVPSAVDLTAQMGRENLGSDTATIMEQADSNATMDLVDSDLFGVALSAIRIKQCGYCGASLAKIGRNKVLILQRGKVL